MAFPLDGEALTVLKADRRPTASLGPSLTSAGLRFEARLATENHGLRYLGPTLRGLFGFVFKELVCITPHGRCERCRLRPACPFARVFDGVPTRADGAFSGVQSAPQPFVLGVASPGSWWGRTDELIWTLSLFGSAVGWIPYLVEAFLRAGERGVGRDRVPFDVRRIIDEATAAEVYNAEQDELRTPVVRSVETGPRPTDGRVRWYLETPLDIRHKGESLLSSDAGVFIKAGRRRFHALVSQHGQGVSPPPLVPAETFQIVSSSLRPWQFQRYSSRRQESMAFRGLVGWIDIEGPWSKEGSWVAAAPRMHVGKHTAFGFGRVRWEQLA